MCQPCFFILTLILDMIIIQSQRPTLVDNSLPLVQKAGCCTTTLSFKTWSFLMASWELTKMSRASQYIYHAKCLKWWMVQKQSKGWLISLNSSTASGSKAYWSVSFLSARTPDLVFQHQAFEHIWNNNHVRIDVNNFINVVFIICLRYGHCEDLHDIEAT